MAAEAEKVKKLDSVEEKNKMIANRYRIEKKLGKGKSGKTYLVMDIKNDELYVNQLVL